MSKAYQRSVALKAAVLRHIKEAGGTISGHDLVEKVKEFCKGVRGKDPTFDFVFTLGGATVYDLMDWMQQTGFITIDESRPSLTWEYGRMNLRLTAEGSNFIDVVRREIAAEITDLFS